MEKDEKVTYCMISRGVQIIWLTTTKSITKPFHFLKPSPLYKKPSPFHLIPKLVNRFTISLQPVSSKLEFNVFSRKSLMASQLSCGKSLLLRTQIACSCSVIEKIASSSSSQFSKANTF